MFRYKSQVLGKYKVSEIKLPGTLEITSHAGYDTIVSNKLAHSIHPQSPCRAGCLKGYSGFRLIAHDLCVGPVPYWLHSALSKEIHPCRCARLCYSPPQHLWASPTGAVPALHPRLSSSGFWPPMVSCPSLLPCDFQFCCSMHPSFFL